MEEHSLPVCSDAIDHKKKVSDEDGHVRDIANLPFPPSDGIEGHSEFYSEKAPLTLSDDDSETEYEDVEKGNKDGNVEKRKIDDVEKNEGRVEKKRKIKLYTDTSSDDDSDNNKGVNRFVLSKNRKSDDVLSKTCEANDDEEYAFPETEKKLVQVYGHEIKRIQSSDSEIEESERIRKLEKNCEELLARKNTQILRDEAEQNNFFAERITFSSSSEERFTGKEKDNDYIPPIVMNEQSIVASSNPNSDEPAVPVLNEQNNDGKSSDDIPKYIDRSLKTFIQKPHF